jgi:shikimate 5-dehydrogenase
MASATPIGVRQDDPSPFAPEIVRRNEAVIDIVIAGSPSRLRRDTKRFGKTFIEGAAMVRGQAECFRRFPTTPAASGAAVARIASRPSRCGESG